MAAPIGNTILGGGIIQHFRPSSAIQRTGPAPASGMGSAGLARLQGLFAVYKPPGLKWKHLRDTVELQLLKGECLEPDPGSRSRSLGVHLSF